MKVLSSGNKVGLRDSEHKVKKLKITLKTKTRLD